MLASDIATRAARALNDTGNIRWTMQEIVDYINDGQNVIILVRPDANSISMSIQLVAGTKQSLPVAGGSNPYDPANVTVRIPDGIRFLRAVRNMGGTGIVPGRAIRECSRVALDNELPDWHLQSSATSPVQNYVFDNISPRTFYTYPPVPSSAPIPYIEIVYAAVPTKVTTSSGALVDATLSLGDHYVNPLLDFVLFRCYAKDASYAGNMQRADFHIGAVATALQVTKQAMFEAASPQAATPTPAAVAQMRTGG